MNLEKLLPDIIELSKIAGAKILEFYGENSTELNVRQKADTTLLTDADLAAHHIVADGLKKLTPDIPLLSEEGAHLTFEERQKWSRYWLVDPLDGTQGFVERCGEFTVNIALIEDNKSVLGVVYVPVQDICYYAYEGASAFSTQDNNAPRELKTRNMDWKNYGVLLGNAKFTSGFAGSIKRLAHCTVRRVNSSYKLGLLAAGEADFYPRIGKTSEWDTAAGQCVLEAAGGAIVDFNGQPLQYNAKSSLINPPFIAVGDRQAIPKIIELIEKIRREK